MKIIKGKPDQLETIFSLLQACAADMRDQGIAQWNENYPLLKDVQKDLFSQSLYIVQIEGNLAGIVVFDENQSPEYIDVEWEFTKGKIGVIHRLAVHPQFQGKGIARKLMDYIEVFAKKNQYQSIRLDAYSQNPRTLKFYQNRGYKKCGEIYFPYRDDPFDCFEKNLSNC